MQVKLVKSKLKTPGTKRLKLKYDHLLSIFAFNSNFAPLHGGACHVAAAGLRAARCGEAVQVDTFKTRVDSAYEFSA